MHWPREPCSRPTCQQLTDLLKVREFPWPLLAALVLPDSNSEEAVREPSRYIPHMFSFCGAGGGVVSPVLPRRSAA